MSLSIQTFEALDLWRISMLESVRRDTPDLTARQMTILLTVYFTPPPHTVKGLSTLLKVSKPAVTRALDRLSEYGFVKRKPDENDRRSVHIQRTVKGSVYLREFADIVVESAKKVSSQPQVGGAL